MSFLRALRPLASAGLIALGLATAGCSGAKEMPVVSAPDEDKDSVSEAIDNPFAAQEAQPAPAQ